MLVAEKIHLWISRLQCLALRAIADHQLLPRQIEGQKRLDILLRGDPPDIQKHWFGRAWQRFGWTKQPCIDALAPQHQTLEAPTGKLVAHAPGGHQHGLARPVESAQKSVAPPQWNQGPAGVYVLGETCVDGAGEGQTALDQPAPCRPAQWPFSRQVHAIRLKRADRGTNLPEVPHQGNFRVTGAWQRAKVSRRQQLDLMAKATQFADQRLQTGDHTIDLGCPGVGDDQNPHRAGSAAATGAACSWRA